ncbi:MAG: aromatic ring-hydroxylating dioxygenase subunit alpha [Halioglobus sp.]|nr:aromatic ring-hydroxylating dioxygenase subunit alpha [Halioglobus sp.]
MLLSDTEVIDRIFDHIDAKSTDQGSNVWREPVDHYQSQERFDKEIRLLRRLPVPFCPSGALPKRGSYLTRMAAGRSILAVRGADGMVRAFFNVCRHRGMAVADGEGCTKSFVCPYHAWTYSLDGTLKHIPGHEGFPGINKEEHSLKPVVQAKEQGGIVFVAQEEPVSQGALGHMPNLLSSEQRLFDKSEFTDPANWKLVGETSMEGYHIKALHKESFYPYGYNNLNVIETFGPNARVVFPFRRIEKLRAKARHRWRLDGMVTDVYQLFPNAHLTVLSSHSLLIILEPVSPVRTRYEIFRIGNRGVPIEDSVKDASFVKDTGLQEDRNAAISMTQGLNSPANNFMTFGQYEEGAIHFHRHLDNLLNKL